jgi:hypothetical protein
LADIADFTSIVIAVVAVIISLIVFYYSRKREEFGIASDSIIEMKRLFNEVLNTEMLRKERTENPEASPSWRYVKEPGWNPEWSKIQQFLGHLEFMDLLIKNKEIRNKSIIHHFTDMMQRQLVIVMNYQGDRSSMLREKLESLKKSWSWYEKGRMEKLTIKLHNLFRRKDSEKEKEKD